MGLLSWEFLLQALSRAHLQATTPISSYRARSLYLRMIGPSRGSAMVSACDRGWCWCVRNCHQMQCAARHQQPAAAPIAAVLFQHTCVHHTAQCGIHTHLSLGGPNERKALRQEQHGSTLSPGFLAQLLADLEIVLRIIPRSHLVTGDNRVYTCSLFCTELSRSKRRGRLLRR